MLTPKQSLFVKEYLVDLNATQAAIRAGYSFSKLPGDGYYVYFLVNPDTGMIFYVGKGKNDRIKQHVKFAEKGVIDNVGKFTTIRNILKAGKRPIELVFAVHHDESKMYGLERELITNLRSHGLENISSGFKDNSRIDIEKAKLLLSQMRPLEEWKRIVPKSNVQWIVNNYGSLEGFYARMKREIINVILWHSSLYRRANS